MTPPQPDDRLGVISDVARRVGAEHVATEATTRSEVYFALTSGAVTVSIPAVNPTPEGAAMSRVEVLFFDGCPNVDVAVGRARRAAEAAGIADVRLARVTSNEDAQRLGFLGSPTVRVDGLDVEMSARGRSDFGLQCRVYSVGGKFDGAPPVEWIERALRAPARP